MHSISHTGVSRMRQISGPAIGCVCIDSDGIAGIEPDVSECKDGDSVSFWVIILRKG